MTDFHPGYLLNGLIYSLMGIGLFLVSFSVLVKIIPYAVWKGICEERNTALAILVGAVSIGLSIIIASAMH